MAAAMSGPYGRAAHSMAILYGRAVQHGSRTGAASALPPVAAVAAVAGPPSALRMLLYLPAAWLLQLIVSDLLHLLLHGCTALAERAKCWGGGWRFPARIVGAVGHIHTVHHQHVDAFGAVSHRHWWGALLLDKLVKRSLIQLLSWKAWTGVLHIDNAMEDFLKLPRTTAVGARSAMALMLRVEALRTVALIGQALLHRRQAQRRGDGSNSNSGCPIVREEDHPPLGRLPLASARRLAASIADDDPQALLKWRFLTTPLAHSLHHYHAGNFPFQIVDFRALLLLLRGASLEWGDLVQQEVGWQGSVGPGLEMAALRTVSVDALAPLRAAQLRLALARAMCGGAASRTHSLSDDLHVSVAAR